MDSFIELDNNYTDNFLKIVSIFLTGVCPIGVKMCIHPLRYCRVSAPVLEPGMCPHFQL
jgi:hypothetical protein